MNLLPSIHTSIIERELEKLITPPIIVTVNDFNEAAAKTFRADMNKAANTGQKVIPVVIDSYGGAAYSVLSMIDTIKSMPVTVATIVEGKAMSCGSILFSYGTPGYRYAAPNSTLLIHQVASWAQGKLDELKASVEESARLNDMIYREMSVNCGKKPSFFVDEMEKRNNADWYLNPKEGKSIGLVNYIKTPSYKVGIEVKHVFG